MLDVAARYMKVFGEVGGLTSKIMAFVMLSQRHECHVDLFQKIKITNDPALHYTLNSGLIHFNRSDI